MGKIIITLANNLLGLLVYWIMFSVILFLGSDEFDKEEISIAAILSLFFGILNELHRDLKSLKDKSTKSH